MSMQTDVNILVPAEGPVDAASAADPVAAHRAEDGRSAILTDESRAALTRIAGDVMGAPVRLVRDEPYETPLTDHHRQVIADIVSEMGAPDRTTQQVRNWLNWQYESLGTSPLARGENWTLQEVVDFEEVAFQEAIHEAIAGVLANFPWATQVDLRTALGD